MGHPVVHEIDGTLYRTISHWGLFPVYVEGNPIPRYDVYRIRYQPPKHIEDFA